MTSASVLIVDDTSDLRESLSDLLAAHGFETAVAVDGVDALDQLGGGLSPDVILLDWMMPRMDGAGFLAEYRRRAGRARVVVMTAFTGALEGLGDALLLRKPFDPRRLLEVLSAPKS